VNIPEEVRYIIGRLEVNGFEAYAVGGCVRDAVLGVIPEDWDICTSALPEQTARCFDGYNIIETGLKHGTITLRVNHKSYEITTYRIDGVYSDNRRPDNVEFTNDLKNDLSRRDFTINAMAYNPRTGIIDYFGGMSDIECRIIRCVGDANKRFKEDALRIMRALRFASVMATTRHCGLDPQSHEDMDEANVGHKSEGHRGSDLLCRPPVSSTRHCGLDPQSHEDMDDVNEGQNRSHCFNIEQDTSEAIFRNKELLNNIAAERVAVELNKLIVGEGAGEVLLSYIPVFEVFIPEIANIAGFKQNSKYHYLDVWEHTVKSVVNAPKDVCLRLTMLLHDIAKPQCYTEVDSVGHFYGHPQLSSDMARVILNRLKYDNDTIKTVTTLILYHDTDIEPNAKHIKRWLNRIGEQKFRQLLAVKRADSMAKVEEHRDIQLKQFDEVLQVLDEVIKEQQCFSLKDLAVDGRDLIAIGITEGSEIGTTLNRLLDMVIDGEIENEKETLLIAANNGKESRKV